MRAKRSAKRARDLQCDLGEQQHAAERVAKGPTPVPSDDRLFLACRTVYPRWNHYSQCESGGDLCS